jgi:hypothetical protein
MPRGDLDRVGYLYFVASERQGAIKIGFAEEVYMRLKSLQTGNPDELTLLAVVPCRIQAETLLHQYLKHKRIRLEWYPDDAEIERLIYELQDDMVEFGIESSDADLEGLDGDLISSLLKQSYMATPLPTDLILQRVHECCPTPVLM